MTNRAGRSLRWFALAAAALLAAAPIRAESKPSTYRIDAVHTQVLFFASHLGFSKPMGRFPGVSGNFVFDPDDWTTARAEIEIDIGSLYLGDEPWEKKMLAADFFAAGKHKTARFVGRELVATGKNRARLTGELTLRGVTRPLSLDVTVNRVGRHTFSFDQVAGFSATGTLKRSDFGMKRLLPAVGDEVELRLEVEGIREGKADARGSDR